MGTFSIWHWLIVGFILGLVIWIYGRIARKAGFSRWWSLTMFIPLVNLVMIWVFAFVKWPAEDDNEQVAEVFE